MRLDPTYTWREHERRRFATAEALCRGAAIELVRNGADVSALPLPSLLEELLAHRLRSEVDSVRISIAAAKRATEVVLAEMARRRVRSAAASPEWAEPLSDADLARLAGRVYEVGQSVVWFFRSRQAQPERIWDVSRAKQAGCFFTPQFVAEHLARSAVADGANTVLDPAVGAGALLIEAYLVLAERMTPDEALASLYGVDIQPDLVRLASAVLTFLAGRDPAASLDGQIVSADALVDEVFGGRQFDSVVMNPPYLQLKFNSSTLPARENDDAATAALRQKALEGLREQAQSISRALDASGLYSEARGGVPDLPRFFIERSLMLLRPGGRLACIVPSTFLSDHRSRRLRRHLSEQHRLAEINWIPEQARLFPDVNQPTCTLVVCADGRTDRVAIRYDVAHPSKLAQAPKRVNFREIRAVDPEHLRIPGCTSFDWAILAKLHRSPRLGDLDGILNLRGELDLTIDKHWVTNVGPGARLVRGDQIERYTSALPSAKPSRVAAGFEMSALKARHVDATRIVIRQCSYLKKPRRLSCALVPAGCVVANSCNYVLVEEPLPGLTRDESLLYLLAMLNSKALEWRFRLLSSTNHVGNYELATLPIPPPAAVPALLEGVRSLLGNPHNAATDAAVDQIVYELFDLTSAESRHIEAAVSSPQEARAA